MKLSAYLKLHNIRPANFAAIVGVPASTISRIASGQRMPRVDTAQRIAEATNGEVSLEDFVSHDVPRPAPVLEDA